MLAATAAYAEQASEDELSFAATLSALEASTLRLKAASAQATAAFALTRRSRASAALLASLRSREWTASIIATLEARHLADVRAAVLGGGTRARQRPPPALPSPTWAGRGWPTLHNRLEPADWLPAGESILAHTALPRASAVAREAGTSRLLLDEHFQPAAPAAAPRGRRHFAPPRTGVT